MSAFWSFVLHDLAIPIMVSYLSVYLDQKWHAIREFKSAFARTRSLGTDSNRYPEKVTLDALFAASLSELQYRSDQAGKNFQDVLWDLERYFPEKKFRLQ